MQHIVITRERDATGRFDTHVRVYRSLSEAARKAFEAARKKQLIQFCIEHPYADVLSIEEMTNDQL